MKVLVTGSHGLIGSQLVEDLKLNDHQVGRLARVGASSENIFWNPDRGEIDKNAMEGFDAVVHLAGDNIASGRWTSLKKERIRQSRIDGTSLLANTLASMRRPPETLISASAIGFYGDRGDQILTEESLPGEGFLADVCRQWEAATQPAQQCGIRVVHLRIGVVLSPRGGALSKMLPPFQIGAGGRLGSGKQYMSWVSLDDLCRIVVHCLCDSRLTGPVNAVSPNPVNNSQFTSALGASLTRPTLFPVPELAINLLMGEMANELLLSSTRVLPEKLLATDFQFKHPEVAPFLNELLHAA